MNMHWFLWGILLTAMEIFLKYYLLERRLGSGKNGMKPIVGALIIFILMAVFRSMPVNSSFLLGINFLVSIGYAYTTFGSGQIARIVWGCFAGLLPAMTDTLAVLIAETFHYGDMSGMWSPGSVWFYITATSLMIEIIIVLTAANIKSYSTYSLTVRQLLFLVGMSAVSIIALNLQMEIVSTLANMLGTQKAQYEAVFVSLCFLIILTALIFLVYSLGKQSQKTIEKTLEARQEHLEKEYYRSNEVSVNALRGLRHDISTHMHVMKRLMDEGRTEELREYFDSVENQYRKSSALFLTEDTMLNALLTSKQMTAQNSHINMQLSYATKRRIPLSTADLCSLMGNMIDNAMDACKKVTDEKLRYIDISVGDRGEMVYIKVKNGSDGTYHIVDGELQTTKTGTGHGIGLKRIRSIAESAGGFFDINPRPDVFTAIVMLPSERKEGDHDQNRHN